MKRMHSKLVFLLRAYNDLDHNAPIANFLLGKGVNVLLVNIDSNVDEHDYRIDLLRRHPNFDYLEVENWDFTKDKPARGLKSTIERVFYKIFLSSETSFLWTVVVTFWLKRNQGIEDVVEDADCVFFEWGRPVQRGVAALVIHRLAKAYEIPTVALPHGCNTFARGGANSVVRHLATRRGGSFGKKPFWEYNYYCVQNPHRKVQLESNVGAPRNIVAIGSIRFSDEWRSEMRRSISNQKEVHGAGFKVTLMEFQKGYGVAEHGLAETIRRIEQIPRVSFVLKRSTREGKSLGLSSKRVVVGNECHSMPLIAESDCVVVCGSSIAIEVVLQGKLLITPSYLGIRESFFEKYDIGLTPTSTTQLEDMLERASVDENVYAQMMREQNAKLAMVKEEYVNGGDRDGPEEGIIRVLEQCGIFA